MTSIAEMAEATVLGGDLVKPVLVADARALSSTRIRIDFTDAVLKTAALSDVNNYSITAGLGDVVPFIQSIDVPELTSPTFVELIVSEMTDAAAYTLVVNAGSPASPVLGANGLAVATDPAPFTGIGVAPEIELVLAISATSAEVRFTEQIQATAIVATSTFYTFNLGLTVVAVTDIVGNVVTLETSVQTEGELYTLTVNPTGDILDYANNPMAKPATGPMLGFSAAPPVDLPLKLSMYRFLLQTIRDEDQERGHQFVERFLEGPQAIWRIINDTILAIPNLWSTTEAPDAALQFLKDIVGWGGRLGLITDALTAPVLRRLIAASAAFWKGRGPEDAIEDILRLTTGARVRVVNWFGYRWVIGETQMSEEWEGTDPWVIGGPGTADVNTYNVRIVDDGSLDRALVRNLVKVTRPLGERVDISYLRFADFFTATGDKTQWVDIEGTSVVENGLLRLVNTGIVERSVVSVDGALDWTNYVATLRVRGSVMPTVVFYHTGDDDYYELRFFVATNVISLRSIVAGVPTALASFDLDTIGEEIPADTFFSVRVEAIPEGASTRIRVYFDASGALVNVLDSDHAEGTIGVRHLAGDTIEMDGVELFLNPMEADFIDINTQV
jgi:phage tail-like protein